jgi:cobalt-zinc-cadmium efflux system protein
VIIAAVLIRFTGAGWIDPLVSVLIGAIILVSAYRVTRKSLHILVEGVPEGMSVKKINESMRTIAGVDNVHDLHIWNLNSEKIALSAHVVLSCQNSHTPEEVMSAIKKLMLNEFGISHTTLQFESVPCGEGHGGCN